ncbi:MAG: MFS transporter [Candidatus Korobacteraceae bacterium]|jgi:putative MFS transporter
MTYLEFLDHQPMTKFLWLLLCGVLLAEILDGMDFQMTAFAMPGIIRGFHINAAQAGAISSAGNIGLMVGATLFSLLCDRIGRKPIFQWVLFCFALGSLLSAVAPTYNALLAARFVAGLGIGSELPIGAAILAEYAPLRRRHIFIALVPLVWSIGWIVAAVLSIYMVPVWGWRSLFWAGVIPAVMIIGVRWFLPESVRFLLSKGKTEEAGKIVEELARKTGRTNLELVPPLPVKGQVKLSFVQQLAMLRSLWAPMVVLALVYFCFFIQTWGINAWLPTIFVRQGFTLAKSFTYTLIILCVTPLSHLIAMWLQERINRKWAMLLLTTVGTVLFVMFGLSFQYKWPIQAIVTVQLLQTLAVQGVITILYTLSAELFPTPVRSLGIGFVQSLGRFGAVLGPFALGLFLTFGTDISHVIYFFAAPLLVAAILAVIVIRFDPRKHTLEQITTEVEAEVGMAAGH